MTPTTTAAATATSQATVASTSPPAPFPGAPIQLGDAIGRILIPKIGVNDVIVAGVRTQDIAKGVGHFPDTPMPGQQGNAALAGHRTTHGAVFGDLDKLVPGDEVDVIDLDAKRYTYLVTGSFVVHPNQIEVLADHPDKVMLTLTTCNPKYTARDRLVVTAELRVGGDEPAVQPATPRYGNPGLYANGVNADDTTSSLGPNEGDTLAPGATTVPGSPSTGRTVSSNVDSLGALNHGWFSDSQAILPVVLWGLALVALALLAWGLSRKTRRLIGWGVALVPFIVLLYFWFENVNRLLPPNL